MLDTTLTLKRAGTIVRTGIPCNIQNMAYKIAVDLGGQSPYDSYWIRSTGGGTLDIRRGDLLIDEVNVDPVTSTNTKYRVFGQTALYGASLDRVPAEQIMGS